MMNSIIRRETPQERVYRQEGNGILPDLDMQLALGGLASVLGKVGIPIAKKTAIDPLEQALGQLGEAGAVFPKKPLPNPFIYEEQATVPRWLQREFGENIPSIKNPRDFNIYGGKIIGSGNNINDELISALMNSERAKNPLITPEQAYEKALDNFFQAERFPGSDTRFSMLKRIDEAARQ